MLPSPQPFSLPAGDGVEITGASHLPPDDPPSAHGVLVHGFAEHRQRYAELISTLVGAGFAVHAFDLRGHGASGGRRGHVRDFAHYASDLDLVLLRVVAPRREPGAPPPFLLAHSLGGLVVLERLLRQPAPDVSTVIVSGPYLAPAFSLPPLARPVARFADRFLPWLSLPAGIDPEGLSRDPLVVEGYRRDPRVFGHLSPRWFLEVEAAQERVAVAAGEITTPCLMALGGADPIADPGRSREVFARLGSEPKELKVYEGFRHEVFNEVGRERVVADVLAWLRRTAA